MTDQDTKEQPEQQQEQKKLQTTESETNGQVLDENELILIQDNAFTVKLQVNGLEPFELQVTSMELVQEINQMLMVVK